MAHTTPNPAKVRHIDRCSSGVTPGRGRAQTVRPTCPDMDTASLIARIDHLLRGSGGTTPSDATLQKVVDVLTRARGGGGQEEEQPERAALPSMEALLASSGSSTSALTESQRSTAASSRAPSQSSRGNRPPPQPADDGGEMGMSLPLGRQQDALKIRTLERHRERVSQMRPVVNIREQQTRQYQALLAGNGGKYVHADIVQNGATQIGGMTSQTPSMWAGPETPMSQIASKIIEGGPPRIRNLPSDFRLA